VIEAYVSPNVSIAATGAVLVEAKTRNAGNVAKATAFAGGFSALGAASSMRVTATDAGAVRATMLGDVTSSSQVTVNARRANSANGKIKVISVGFLFSGTGAGALAEITADADIEAYVGPASSIHSSGAVAVTASGDDEATAVSEIGSGGLLNFTESKPTARTK